MPKMPEAEKQPKPLELETTDGKPIVYIGPHASLLPGMKCVFSPLLVLNVAGPLERPTTSLIREYETWLVSNARHWLKNNGLDPLMQKRGFPPEKVEDIARSLINHSDDLSSCLEYRQASVEESQQLSHYHHMWSSGLPRQSAPEQYPVLNDEEFRSSN